MKDLAADTSGTTAMEYAVIASLISIVIVTAVASIGTQVSSMFASITFTP